MRKITGNPTLLWMGVVSLPLIIFIFVPRSEAQSNQIAATTHEPCKIQSTTYEGWPAQQLSNQWLKLIIVPQLGGRVMQVTFAGHPYLFVNPQLKGKHFPPLTPADKPTWYNYGGDQIWPMPEGTQDAQHWPGPISDALDDGDHPFESSPKIPIAPSGSKAHPNQKPACNTRAKSALIAIRPKSLSMP
jgi:hypothetical protein